MSDHVNNHPENDGFTQLGFTSNEASAEPLQKQANVAGISRNYFWVSLITLVALPVLVSIAPMFVPLVAVALLLFTMNTFYNVHIFVPSRLRTALYIWGTLVLCAAGYATFWVAALMLSQQLDPLHP